MEKIFLRLFAPVLCIVCLFSTLQAQTIRYVKQGGSGNGSDWANASGDFQAMIDASSAGDKVWVAAGDYQTPMNAAFRMKEGVEIAGGFPNTGNPAWGDRNWTTHISRLLGNLKTWNYNGNRVIENIDNGLTAAAVLDGFTLTNGFAYAGNHGGGMFNNNVSPTIRNCVFTKNFGGNEGGGMYNYVSNPTISNCTFSDNQAGYETKGQGGGIANRNSSPVITNCRFINNKLVYGEATNGGGGMYNGGSNPIVTNCSFTGNFAFTAGGVYNVGSSPQFINTRFLGNSSADIGGAVHNYSYSSPVYKFCSFTENTAPNAAGAGNAYYGSSTYLNCLFYNNISNASGGSGRGGAFMIETAQCNIINCTVVGNFASLVGGAIYSTGFFTGFGTNVYIRNSIIQGNNSGIYMSNNIANYENNLIQSYTPHGGSVTLYQSNNITGTTDPLFVNAANPVGADAIWGTADDGLQLQPTSPLVNMGQNGAVPADLLTDLAGAPRIQGGTVDMGAYESAFTVNCGSSTLYVDATRSISGNGDSWSTAFKTLSEAMLRASNCINVNTILVAKGTYYPTGQQNSTLRDSAFLLPQRGGIKIYGGYPNGGGARNFISNPTILSGDIGVAGNHNDNSYHILVMTETLPGADSVVVDGFTFTRANANGTQYYYNGVLTNQNEGGAILFRKNSNIGARLAIRNCNIINNNAIAGGAGIYLWQSAATINNCVIADNNAVEMGAGLFNLETISTQLINSLLSGNTAKNGAAVYNNTASLSVVNNTFSGNSASEQGSSMYNTGAASIDVVNTVLYNNGSNSIHNAATLNITYSDVQQSSGVFSGTGNINADPLFLNASNPAGADGIWRTADDGLKFQSSSPLVNAGTPDMAGLSVNSLDLAGEDRVKLSRIDMGAYESSYINCADVSNVLYVDGTVTQSGTGGSWSTAIKSFADAIDVLNGCNNINTILIAKGTYYPTASSNRDAGFVIPQRGNVKIYGGYPNGGGARDLVANPTILSGDIGALNNNADNSYHVMVIANTDAGADSVVVDGITFTGANGDAGGDLTINGIPVARNKGGGLTVVNNNGNTKINIRLCRFSANRAMQGAGIYNAASSPLIINSYLQGNISTDNGGGMSNYNNAAPTLINVLIAGNQASFGGAFFNDNSHVSFINVTIAGNNALDAAGLYNRYNNANMYFRNSILYGNRRNDGAPSNIYNTSNGKASFSNSLIENSSGAWDPAFGIDEGKNLFSDPSFITYILPTNANTPNSNGDYQLQSGSPAVDAGDISLLPAGITTDLSNALRMQHASTDLGAFESLYFNCSLLTADTTQKNVKCYGSSDGEASLVVSKGTAPMSYTWNNGAHTAGITDITAGNYTCSVTDANGCSISKAFTITEPSSPLAVTTSVDNIKCFGANDGTAGVVITGGTAPYTYSWSNGSTNANISSLSPNSYTCTTTDVNGCEITGSLTISQPAAELTATAFQTDVLCNGNSTGAASLQVNGGTAPYSFEWSTGATDAALTGLIAGTYTCTIRDANGCSVVKEFIITEPAALSVTASSINIQCYGDLGTASVQVNGGTAAYTYNWNNGETTAAIVNLVAAHYDCTVTDANGCLITASVEIIAPASALDASVSQTDILCYNGNNGTASVTASGGAAPYSYSWNNGGTTAAISNLVAGIYTCTLTDNYGCSIVKTFTLTEPAALSATDSQTDILCKNANDGTATITVTGGTAPYSYNWSNGGTTAMVSDLSPGNYSCIVTDANGCELTANWTVTEPAALLLAQVVSQMNLYCGPGNTGAITVQASGGTGNYAYAWSNGGTVPAIVGLTAGNYSCTITDDNGCIANASATITQVAITGNKLFVDNAVTVSGDGNSWTSAFKELSEAIIAAAACTGVDSILVAMGTYSPVGSLQNGNRDSTFLIRQSGGLKISGGYPSGGGTRDIVNNPTVLSGLTGGNNSYHIMVIAGIASGADSIVIDGLTFKGGFATRGSSYKYNGVDVSGNKGAGIYLHSNNGFSKIAIRNCHFVDNVAGEGGAIYNDQVSPVIAGNKFVANIAFNRGGAIVTENSANMLIRSCEFSNNEGFGGGGAIFTMAGTHTVIRNSKFFRNISYGSGGGGAIYNESSSSEIRDCYIAGNKADNNYGGGGVCNVQASSEIINTFFIGNGAPGGAGGALFCMDLANVTLTNCTLYGNIGAFPTGSIYNETSQLRLTNTIIYGTDLGIKTMNGSSTSVNYSSVQDWTGPGTGNLAPMLDPKFVAPANVNGLFINGDYSLAACSPNINAGTTDTTGLNLSALDAATGLPRIQLGRIDIGASEANSLTNANAGAIPITASTTTAYQLKDATTWYALDCNLLIAAITGSGNNPVNGNTTVSVSLDNGLLPEMVSRYYDIEPENNPTASSGTVTLYFTQAEFDAYNTANTGNNKLKLPHKDDANVNETMANIRVRKISGSLESIIIPHTINWNDGAQRWELTFDVPGFSKFYVFTADNTSLPLRLLSFAVQEEDCVAKVSWTTSEEMGVSHFELEHSTDGASWTFLSKTGAVNSSGEHKYKASVNINAAMNYYRLKMVDIDGTVTYSKIVRLVAPQHCVGGMIRLYPNPAIDILFVEKANPGDTYSFYDNTGRLVLQGTINKTIQDIAVRKLLRGVYTVVIVNRAGQLHVVKFIKK